MNKTAKIFSAVLAAAAAFNMCSTAFSASAAESIRILGDLNHDLSVNSCDAQQALEIYTDSVSGLTDGSVNQDNETADINMDGSITVEDAESILLYYCQTLAGKQPLWADFRQVSYENGSSYGSKKEFALRGLYIEVGCAEGAPGTTVTVPVYVAGLSKLAGFQLGLIHEDPMTLTAITSELDKLECWKTADTIISNPETGMLVAAQANDISLADGFVIGEYAYEIPKNAESGAHYCITVDQTYTKFVMTDCVFIDTDPTSTIEKGTYQYTALSGVVTVK